MPRDINGTYTLPAGNPVISNTVIESVWANTTMDDIAAALTDSLSRSGLGGLTGPFLFDDGTLIAPGSAWANEPTSGWYRAGPNDFRFVIAGQERFEITGTSFNLGDFVGVDYVNKLLTFYVPATVGDPIMEIDGINFSITRDGQVNTDSFLSAGSASWGDGSVRMRSGDATLCGYIEWLTPGGVQMGVMGASPVGSAMQLNFNSALTPSLGLVGVPMSISPNSVNLGLYNAAMLSLNLTGVSVTHSGLTVHNVDSAGTSMVAATFMWGGAVSGSIQFSGVATTYFTSSDRRLKEDIRPIGAVGSIIDRLEPVRFRWKSLGGDGVGFIAQDVIEIVPEAVGVPAADSDTPWQMDAGKLMPYVIAELKSLRGRVDHLEK